jgi:hypothetical protein
MHAGRGRVGQGLHRVGIEGPENLFVVHADSQPAAPHGTCTCACPWRAHRSRSGRGRQVLLVVGPVQPQQRTPGLASLGDNTLLRPPNWSRATRRLLPCLLHRVVGCCTVKRRGVRIMIGRVRFVPSVVWKILRDPSGGGPETGEHRCTGRTRVPLRRFRRPSIGSGVAREVTRAVRCRLVAIRPCLGHVTYVLPGQQV